MQVQLNKVNVLSNENKRLKTKQTKLKTAYDSLNQKHNTLLESVKTTEDKLMHQTEACLALRHELDEIRRNQDKVDKSVVTGIMARIKVAGTGYTLLVKESGKTEWHSDHQIVKIQEQLYTEWKQVNQVVYEAVIPERQRLEQELQTQMTKHQERLQRLNDVVERQN